MIALQASWLLTLVLFSVFPFFVLVQIAELKFFQGRSNKNKQLIVESSKTANEAVNNIRTVASLGLEDKFNKMYQEQLHPPFMYEKLYTSSYVKNSYDMILYIPSRSNMKSVVTQAVVFAVAQAMVFYIYPAGLRLGAFQIASDPSSVYHAKYEEVFR